MMREVMGLESDEICKELTITANNLWVILYRARMYAARMPRAELVQGRRRERLKRTYDLNDSTRLSLAHGQAGPSLAPSGSAKTGRKTAIIERKRFGGTCVNVGCIPTKTLIASARAAHVARTASRIRRP